MPHHYHPIVLCPSAEVHQAPRAGFQLGQHAVKDQASSPHWWPAITAPSFVDRECRGERTLSPHICLAGIPSLSTPTLFKPGSLFLHPLPVSSVYQCLSGNTASCLWCTSSSCFVLEDTMPLPSAAFPDSHSEMVSLFSTCSSPLVLGISQISSLPPFASSFAGPSSNIFGGGRRRERNTSKAIYKAFRERGISLGDRGEGSSLVQGEDLRCFIWGTLSGSRPSQRSCLRSKHSSAEGYGGTRYYIAVVSCAGCYHRILLTL